MTSKKSEVTYRADSVVTTVEDVPAGGILSSFHPSKNYPNPFNPSTTIELSLPSRSHVRLSIWNVIGQEIAVLVDEEKPAGIHQIVWNASGLPSGIYLSRLEAQNFRAARKMILVK